MAHPDAIRGLPAASYARTSADPRGRHTSTRDQHTANRRAGDALGVTWPGTVEDHEYTDDDRSASRRARRIREDWARLVADLESGARRVVVMTEYTRAYRDLSVFLPFRDLLERTHAFLVYGGHVYDMTDAMDRTHATFDALRAEGESDTIAMRADRTRTLAAERGDPHGHVPYGYRRRYDDRTGQLLGQELDEAEAEVVREVVKRLTAGQGDNEVARHLTARGILSPSAARDRADATVAWNGQGVKWLAVRPLNAGLRRAGGELMPGNWPAIVSVDEWRAVCSVVNARSGVQRAQRGRPTALVHPLSLVATCSLCGGLIEAHAPGARLDYRCRDCTRVKVNGRRFEAYVIRLFTARLERPDAAAALAAASQTERAERLTADLDAARAELAQARVLAERGELSVLSLASAERGLLPRIEHAEAELERLTTPHALVGLVGPRATRLVGDLSISELRAAIRAAMTIVVRPARYRGDREIDGRLDIEWRF